MTTFYNTELYSISRQSEKKILGNLCALHFDHQPRNEKAKNNSTFTTIDVHIPGDPYINRKISTQTI